MSTTNDDVDGEYANGDVVEAVDDEERIVDGEAVDDEERIVDGETVDDEERIVDGETVDDEERIVDGETIDEEETVDTLLIIGCNGEIGVDSGINNGIG